MAKRQTQNQNPDTGAQRRNPEGKTSEKQETQRQGDDLRQHHPDVGEQEDVNDEMMEDEEDEMEDEEEEEEDMI
jgi:hypothetical protein